MLTLIVFAGCVSTSLAYALVAIGALPPIAPPRFDAALIAILSATAAINAFADRMGDE